MTSSPKSSSQEQREYLFDLKATHNPHRWYLPVEDNVSVGPPGKLFLFGGVGLASSIQAIELTTGRPTVWAAAQYLSFARVGEIVDLDVLVPVSGKYNSQARVVGHVGDREIFTVNAALGERPSDISAQWAEMPKVVPPSECQPVDHWREDRPDLHGRIDARVVKGRYGEARKNGGLSDDGHVVLWLKMREDLPINSSALAVFADFVPSAIGNAIGRNAGGNSLDNTIRIRQMVPTEWVLCDIRIHGVHNGFAHGRMHLFAESGELMASASQSVILRIHD
ncbi:MAG: thioesterase family protein [Alphaproteobacteria bacterium]|nr:thioesterase family protein [Alphaproteobacteria bacterium]MDF1626225.1 thioesterase family protein [Parvibaculaceae bacterium]